MHLIYQNNIKFSNFNNHFLMSSIEHVDRTSAHRKQHPDFEKQLDCFDVADFKEGLMKSRLI